jgi:hypothetical protein
MAFLTQPVMPLGHHPQEGAPGTFLLDVGYGNQFHSRRVSRQLPVVPMCGVVDDHIAVEHGGNSVPRRARNFAIRALWMLWGSKARRKEWLTNRILTPPLHSRSSCNPNYPRPSVQYLYQPHVAKRFVTTVRERETELKYRNMRNMEAKSLFERTAAPLRLP